MAQLSGSPHLLSPRSRCRRHPSLRLSHHHRSQFQREAECQHPPSRVMALPPPREPLRWTRWRAGPISRLRRSRCGLRRRRRLRARRPSLHPGVQRNRMHLVHPPYEHLSHPLHLTCPAHPIEWLCRIPNASMFRIRRRRRRQALRLAPGCQQPPPRMRRPSRQVRIISNAR